MKKDATERRNNMNLNEQQQQVVNELSQSILLNAPAGTGKTRVLAARVAHIIAQKKAKGRKSCA